MDDDQDDQESKPTFRIRFTISSGGPSSKSDSHFHHHHNSTNCNEEFYDPSNPSKENENQKCNCKIDSINLNNNNSSNQHHNIYCEIHHPKRTFKFIQPQNHKSSLFVSLSDTSRRDNNNNSNTSTGSSPQQGEHNNLFVSPDLDQYIPASPPSPADSALTYSSSLQELFANSSSNNNNNNSADSRSTSELDHIDITTSTRSPDDSTMSHSCNFMNWSSAARNRSKSVTRSNSPLLPNADANGGGRRASSSNDLAAPANPLANKSTSGNHLAANASSETICDQTTTNQRANNNHHHHHGSYLKHSDVNTMKPLEIQIDVPERCIPANQLLNQYNTMSIDPASQPISLNDILQVDMESLRLEDECRMLESQVQMWEDKVDQLERERFRRTASRSLIDKLIQKRKHIRDLDFQLFKLNLEAQDSDCLSQQLSPLSDSENHIQSCLTASKLYKDGLQAVEIRKLGTNLAAGRYGSQIKPGQENTADILDAIPPSGQLQHKQYLTKATTVTDHSDYARLPSVQDRHRHILPRRSSRQMDQDSPTRESQMQLGSPNRFSPVRPDHFKGDFLPNHHVIVSEDSSSPTSGSENPQ